MARNLLSRSVGDAGEVAISLDSTLPLTMFPARPCRLLLSFSHPFNCSASHPLPFPPSHLLTLSTLTLTRLVWYCGEDCQAQDWSCHQEFGRREDRRRKDRSKEKLRRQGQEQDKQGVEEEEKEEQKRQEEEEGNIEVIKRMEVD